MPSIHDLQKKIADNKKVKPQKQKQVVDKKINKKTSAAVKEAQHEKRRPGREQPVAQELKRNEEEVMSSQQHKGKKVKNVEVKSSHEETHAAEPTHHEESHGETHAQAGEATDGHHEAESEKKKVEINFPGSELLKATLPRPFAVAEKVATEWVNDGDFEGLPLGHPLAQMLAANGLKKAKEVEKKIVASGVIEKVAMQAFTYGLKAQQEITNIREQVRSKFGKK